MIVVDKFLAQREAQNRPIRVGVIGAGFMGRGVVRQITKYTLGMQVVAIANRHIGRAEQAYREAGIDRVVMVEKQSALEDCIVNGEAAITEDALLLTQAEGIDCIFEVTGAVEHSAHVVTSAIEHGKHVVAMNAELDGTVGPLLAKMATEANVVFTNSDGDQPGVTGNLYRYVAGLGVTPVLCGNIKGLQDRYRNPTTQEGFAKKWGQNVQMVTSFADGTKISFEQAITANATSMKVLKRGMTGITVPAGTPLKEVVSQFPLDKIVGSEGFVDYVVGAEPGPGVFILGTHDDPVQQHYLNLYKLGEGPLYLFYHPYHLCHFEAPTSIARAVLFNDATLVAEGLPMVDVVTLAKTDLKAGTVLDGIGGYYSYGEAENADVCLRERLLPMGLAEGCRLRRDVAKDVVLTYEDVDIPEGRLIDRLRAQQDDWLRRRTL